MPLCKLGGLLYLEARSGHACSPPACCALCANRATAQAGWTRMCRKSHRDCRKTNIFPFSVIIVPAQAYITSRLESVGLVLQNSLLEDMLDNEEQLSEQMDALPYLVGVLFMVLWLALHTHQVLLCLSASARAVMLQVRFQYDKSAAYIASRMDPIIEAFKQVSTVVAVGTFRAATQVMPPHQLAICEGQLTWMVYIVGAIVKGRLSSSSAESQENIDGDLAARVLGLLTVMDEGFHRQRYGERSRQRLDMATINFFQCFRKVYIGEQVCLPPHRCTKALCASACTSVYMHGSRSARHALPPRAWVPHIATANMAAMPWHGSHACARLSHS
eukprot:351893-Chlamydomonas_euryale.AAC.21